MDQELEQLGYTLCSSIAASQTERTEELIHQCVALHTPENHDTLMSILERARRVALMQRSFAYTRLANLHLASRYLTRG